MEQDIWKFSKTNLVRNNDGPILPKCGTVKPIHPWEPSGGLCPLEDSKYVPIFTVLHGMQTGSSDENCLFSCLSVCLSNVCIMTKWNNDLSSVLYYTKGHVA